MSERKADAPGVVEAFPRERVEEVLRAIYKEARAENLTFMAGSIAYHAFVSLLPLLVLLLLTADSIGSTSLTERVLSVVEIVLTAEARRLVTESVATEQTLSSVSVLGVGILVWATLRIFRGLDTAFSEIYETEEFNDLPDQILDGLVVFVSVAGAVIVAAAIHDVLGTGGGPVSQVVQTAFVVAGLFVVFLPMYYVFPDTNLALPDVVVGTLFTAVSLTALETVFRFYVEFSGKSESYGILGGIVVLVTWLYFVGLVILLGAVINAVLTNRTRDLEIDPVIGDWRAPDAFHDDSLASRLDEVRWRISDGSSVQLLIDDETLDVPTPRQVRVLEDDDADDGETEDRGLGIEFRW